MHPLNNSELARIAPSILAGNASVRMSERYSFVPTIEVVDAMRLNGWHPVKAMECKVRNYDRRGFQKHMIRFRHADQSMTVGGDSLPEIVLVNSHDGSSAYQLHAGIFRLVCSNGMVVADTTFNRISVKHVGFDKDQIIDASFKVLSEVPKLAASVDGMRSLQLTAGEQNAFAQASIIAKYGDKPAPIEPSQVLRARRYEDDKPDLWSTLNRVQENLTQGGLRGRNPNTMRRSTTREIRGIDESVNVNKALWRLAEEMKALKVAQ